MEIMLTKIGVGMRRKWHHVSVVKQMRYDVKEIREKSAYHLVCL
jgi:hypothetical protein